MNLFPPFGLNSGFGFIYPRERGFLRLKVNFSYSGEKRIFFFPLEKKIHKVLAKNFCFQSLCLQDDNTRGDYYETLHKINTITIYNTKKALNAILMMALCLFLLYTDGSSTDKLPQSLPQVTYTPTTKHRCLSVVNPSLPNSVASCKRTV